jgi:hypothetical protein
VAASFKVIDVGPNHRLIEAVTSDPAGQPLTNRIVQMASGMNWLNPDTDTYEPAQSEFELTAEGFAVITRAQTRLIASPNLNHPEGALDLLAADGRRLRWTVVGISLFDAASGEQVQVGAVRDSVARWVGPNELIWPDCFEGLAADLRVIVVPPGGPGLFGALLHDRSRPAPDRAPGQLVQPQPGGTVFGDAPGQQSAGRGGQSGLL